MYRDLVNAIKNICTIFCFSIIAVEATLTFLNAKRSEYSLTPIKSNTNNLHQQKNTSTYAYNHNTRGWDREPAQLLKWQELCYDLIAYILYNRKSNCIGELM